MNNPLSKIKATKSVSLSKEAIGSQVGHSKKRKKSDTAKDTNPSQPLTSNLVVAGMHKEFHVKSSSHSNVVFSSSIIIHSESASGHDASADSTAEVGHKKFAPKDLLSEQQETIQTKIRTEKKASNDQEFNTSSELTSSDDVTREIKLKDLSKLLKNVVIKTMDLDSLKDDQPFIVQDNKDVEVHVEAHAESEGTLVAELKNHKLEVLASLLALLGQVSSITAQLSRLKVLDALSSLLNKVTEALNGPPKTIPQFARDLVTKSKEDKGNKTLSREEEVVGQESVSDSNAEIRLTGFMVKSSKQKHLKKFSYVNEQGESFLMTEEEIKNQKKVEQDIKVDLYKKEVEL
nr:hypothetical protein [Tanacetum cinerariifolium]